MELVLATHNAHKVAEVGAILANSVPGLNLLGYEGPEPVEDGVSFLENALIKARAAFEFTGRPAIADDSGLAVEILGGAPGIFSARWSGTRDNQVNRQLLLAQLADVKPEHRAAAFVCTIAYVDRENEVSFTGIWPGSIATQEHGEHGFGYDPIFIPEGFEVTAAQLDPEVKNLLSHRSLALEQLASYLGSIEN
ncbi:RdgB/HAM1 family non-canonical purine NTP pyrophosphatase [Rhodoluna sp. KAS3]|jgi:XTP/dITP diphosphohydrolase|uniref:RdgB/HAM1 family non-canonical purine NTP pyrophosphatase n=1 Tax=Rhodoluna sp. KAS3 TaxID=942880 RepID=UPI002231D5EC|nr:RdgB/HAM1 family non-canonical purine NTP pyrophosphatase [Rhodoluna sp. KAS3]BDS48782.1 non-canonical purine NTP pyrophosphatase [Rhodoluna sp. KAS3]